jgi:hypothetical protein
VHATTIQRLNGLTSAQVRRKNIFAQWYVATVNACVVQSQVVDTLNIRKVSFPSGI